MLREGPQVVSRRGTEAAVLVPIEQWHRLQAAARPSLKQLLLAPEPARRSLCQPVVVAWIKSVDDAELYLASVTIGEIQAGIELSRDQDSAKADAIERWLDEVCNTFNILTMDGPAFRRWAQLMHRQSDTLYEDAMIAAIAKVHQLTVVTRNVGDFSHFAVPLLNPFTIHSRAALT